MLSILQDANAVERSHRTDDEEFYRLEKKGFQDLKDFMLKASEWVYYYNYDRSHDGLGGKSPAEALQEINPKLPSLQDSEGKEILFLPPTILDDTITLLGGGTEVYRHYTIRRFVPESPPSATGLRSLTIPLPTAPPVELSLAFCLHLPELLPSVGLCEIRTTDDHAVFEAP